MPDAQPASCAAIALGSNLPSAFGDREHNLLAAIEHLRAHGKVRAVSTFFDTTPVGPVAQPRFLNGALLLETPLAPLALLRTLLAVERAMGRNRAGTPAKGPRVIDLDLLCYIAGPFAATVLATPELTLPHPAMAERRFVLAPLAEIAPTWKHPLTGKTVQAMLADLDAALLADDAEPLAGLDTTPPTS